MTARDTANSDIAAPAMVATAVTLRDLANLIEGASGHLSPDSAWCMYRALNRLADNLDSARTLSDIRQAIDRLRRRALAGRADDAPRTSPTPD